MRNSTLDQMVEALRNEARLSTDSSRGVESRPWLVQLINRWYETLWNDYDWQHLNLLREDSTVALQAGLRYYDIPETVDVDSISKVFLRFGNGWSEIDYGIDHSHYSERDSDNDERADPVQRWTVRDMAQIEVWPIPASNDCALGFEGKRKFARLTKGDDRCLLDDNLIVLFAAAEVLAAHKQADAQKKEQAASAVLTRLRAKASSKARVRMGLGEASNSRQQPGEIRVAYVRNQ